MIKFLLALELGICKPYPGPCKIRFPWQDILAKWKTCSPSLDKTNWCQPDCHMFASGMISNFPPWPLPPTIEGDIISGPKGRHWCKTSHGPRSNECGLKQRSGNDICEPRTPKPVQMLLAWYFLFIIQVVWLSLLWVWQLDLDLKRRAMFYWWSMNEVLGLTWGKPLEENNQGIETQLLSS